VANPKSCFPQQKNLEVTTPSAVMLSAKEIITAVRLEVFV
jgi:hypothetical protein